MKYKKRASPKLMEDKSERLPVELRRAHGHDIGASHPFLNLYLKNFNKQFSQWLNTIIAISIRSSLG